MRTAATIDIAAPPSEVFRWLIEPELLARWIGGFARAEPITEGPVRVGSRSRDVIEADGRRLVLETEITELVPDRRLAVHIRYEGGENDDAYDLEPVAGGTRLTYLSDVRLTGAARLLSLVIAPQLRARARRDLAKLQAEVEAGHGR